MAGSVRFDTSRIVVLVAVGPRMYSITTSAVVAVPQLVQITSTTHQKTRKVVDLLRSA
jgi:hypothetical protein